MSTKNFFVGVMTKINPLFFCNRFFEKFTLDIVSQIVFLSLKKKKKISD